MKALKLWKILCLLLCAALLSGLCQGCAPVDSDMDDGKISIVATAFPQYDFARRIAGDRANITLLLKPGMEAHSYEPSPKDIIRISHCDLFLNVGGESETWLESVLDTVPNPHRRTVAALDCVDPLEEETMEGMQSHEHHHHHDGDEEEHHEDEEEEEEEYDEHVWTSPMNAVKIVNAISEALCEIDPENAPYYRENTDAYVEELLALDEAFREVVSDSQRNVLIFGDRFPLLYFVREYGLTYYAAFPGCAAETEPSAATVAFLIDTVRREKVPVIFYIELSNHKVADAIAECTGVRTALFHTCHNISYDDFASGKTYLSLMQANVEALREALH
ncbi:MAG: zinc ABC transporter substrate-binding protein [Clostridia bacterium]|nr:zinc ABC transporter substrate-binding protein [Clostridia bacterium]